MEKILFSKINEFQKYKKLIENYKFNCWVNCLNRVFKISRKIKFENKNNQLKNVTVLGNDWGLGCNFIHFLDLTYFLNKEKKISKVKTNIAKIVKSKRKGFYEFYGKIIIYFENSKTLTLQSNKGKIKYNLSIKYEKKKYIINELKNNFKIVYKKNTYRYNYNTPKSK